MLNLLLIVKGNAGTIWTGKQSLDCLSLLEQQGEAHFWSAGTEHVMGKEEEL